MIPKIIHYCWFGEKPQPYLVKKCIRSWEKHLPDYKIKCWTEDSFDITEYQYAIDAYAAHKYAYVADVARMHALYYEGGIYMDTDIEILKNLDELLNQKAFTGFENIEYIQTGIIGAEKGSDFSNFFLDYYKKEHFYDSAPVTNVQMITNYFKEKGLILNNQYQKIDNEVSIYPKDYFCPMTYGSDKLEVTKNTFAIHHFLASWKNDDRGYFYRFCKNHRIMTIYHWVEKVRLFLFNKD